MQINDAIKLLIIGDNPDNVTTLSAAVHAALPIAIVLTATNGLSAIELAIAEDPDVILPEIVMPGMDSFEMCRRLKTDDRTSDIPVILLTERETGADSRVKALAAGADGFLSKPLDTTELIVQIRTMTRLKAANRSQRTEKERQQAWEAERTKEIKEELRLNQEMSEKLRESEERFRIAHEISPDGFTILHPLRNKNDEIVDFAWIFENQTIARINGTDPQQVIGKRLLDFFPTHRGTSVFQAYLSVANTGKISILEDVYVGEILSRPTWLRLLVEPIGENIAIFAQDITERKLSEQALQISERFNRDTLNSLSASIAILDEQGIIVAVNQPWLKFASENGADPTAVSTGINYLQVCDLATGEYSDGGSAVANGIRSIIQGRQNFYSMEYPCHSPDQQRWFVVRVTRFTGEGPLRIVVTHENITERMRVEEFLRESEEYLSATLRSIGDAVIACDNDGNVSRMNRVAEALTGWTQDEAVGKPILDVFQIINAETRQAAANPVFRSLRDGLTVGLANHTKLIARSGKEYQIADTCAPIRDISGAIKGAVLVFRDVTEEYRRKEELRKAEERLRFALEKSHTGGFSLNLADDSAYRTPEHARIFGYDSNLTPWSSEIFLNHIIPEDRGEVARLLRRSITTGEDLFFERRIRRTDGVVRWIRANAGLILDAAGRPYQMAGIVQDITENKLAEDALAEKTYLLSESQRIAHIGSYIWDMVTGSIQWSDECYRLYGVSRNTFVVTAEAGITCIHPEDQPKAQEWVRALVGGDNPYPVTYRTVWPDGSVHWLVTAGEVYRDADGKPMKMIGTIQDITERKRVEEELRDREAFINAVLDNLPVGVAVNSVEPTLVFHYMNDHFPKFYRSTREKLADPDAFWEAVYEEPAFRDEIRKRVLDDVASGDQERMIWSNIPITRRGEETHFITARNTPVPGKPLMISSVWDVTEVRKTEVSLRESEQKFSAAFHTSPTVVSITRIADGRYAEVNQAFLNLFEFSRDEVVGHTSTELGILTPDGRTELVQAQLDAGGLTNAEIVARTKSGRQVRLLFSSRTMQLAGEPHHVTTAIDITERKQAEAKLAEQLQELQQWHDVMLDREDRVIELKIEVNELLAEKGEPPRYQSVISGDFNGDGVPPSKRIEK